MPLVIICGRPSVGKTDFAVFLADYLKCNGVDNVHIVNEETEHISKADGYSNSLSEKTTRGALKSAVNHMLNMETVVILDSLNYIKGFRYELYCVARSLRTPHCVCWVDAEDADSDVWNTLRRCEGNDSYEDDILKQLRMRFEMPNDKNRWDSPLFRIVNRSNQTMVLSTSSIPTADVTECIPEVSAAVAKPPHLSSWKAKTKKPVESAANPTAADNGSTAGDERNAPLLVSPLTISGFVPTVDGLVGMTFAQACVEVKAFLDNAVAPAPNSSTVQVPHATADLLYELDRTTRTISQIISAHQREKMTEGTPVMFAQFDRTLLLHRIVSPAELERHRRSFVKANGQLPPSNILRIGSLFIDYLSAQI